MRYTAKIYVMDVMDQIVVSGYVHASDDFRAEPPDMYEFTWQIPGVGLSEEPDWLRDSLTRALEQATPPVLRGGPRAPQMGVLHTLSEAGDMRAPGVD